MGSADIVQKRGRFQYKHIGTFDGADMAAEAVYAQGMLPVMASQSIAKSPFRDLTYFQENFI